MSCVTAILVSGCDLEETGSDGGWNVSDDLMDVSGTYSGSGISGLLVSEFDGSPASGGGGGGGGGGAGSSMIAINDEDGGVIADEETVVEGEFGYHPGIKPGSVTIVFEGPTSRGTFTDDGAGGLSGVLNLGGGDSPRAGTGTMNYDTGIWTLEMSPPGFAENMDVLHNYVINASEAQTVPDTGDGDGNGDGNGDGSGDGSGTLRIYRFQVAQTGNKITIVDSNGDTYAGTLGSVEIQRSGIDDDDDDDDITEEISRRVQFVAEGQSRGIGVEIVGVFQAAEVVFFNSTTDDEGDVDFNEIYRLQSLTISGTWIQDNGVTGSINGVGPSDQRLEAF